MTDPSFVDALLQFVNDLPAPSLIGFEPNGDVVKVHFSSPRPDHRCAGAALFGFEAPRGWDAIAMSVVGRALDIDSRVERHGDARVDLLLTRSGTVRSRLSMPGDPAADDEGVLESAGLPGGIIVDALHRTLGLGCPGSAPPVQGLTIGLWIDHLIEFCEDGRSPTWSDAVAMVPAALGRSAVPPSPECLATAITDASAAISWDRLRIAARNGEFRPPELTAREAAWMDDILFGRWVIDGLPHPEPLLVHLEDHGAGTTAELIRAVLAATDLPVGWNAG